MLNKKTIDVLNTIQGIGADEKSNKITISYPITYVKSVSGDILINYDIRSTEIGEFDNIPIYNLNNFLNTFKLFNDDRVVKRNGKVISISDGSAQANFLLSDPELIPFNDFQSIFKTTCESANVSEFSLSKESLKSLRNASGVFKELDKYVFKTTENGINISLAAKNSFNQQSNSYSVSFISQTEKEFDVALPVNNLNMLPISDYKVSIKYNSVRDQYRLLMESTELENFKIILSFENLK